MELLLIHIKITFFHMEEIIYQILYDFLVIRDTKVAYHGYSTLFLIYDLPETTKGAY